VLWVAIEYVNAQLSPHGTFGSISYTQMDALPIVQVASLAGIWGISFLLLLVPSVLALQCSPNRPGRARAGILAMTALLLVAAIGHGAWRLRAPATASLRVGLVSLEKPILPALHDAQGQTLVARYVEAIDRLADQGARVVLIPETSFATTDTTIPAFAELATRRNLILDVGIDDKSNPQAEHNGVMVFQPTAATPLTYHKHHLIPGLEDHYTPGQNYRLLDDTTRTGLAICKDMDFQDIGRAYSARDAQLLLVPAWDFRIDGWLHSRMAIMRGVESGFAIARAARSGRLTLSDDRGRVVAEASSEKHDAELVGELPLRESRTLYGRWGDWFAWLDLAALLALLVQAVRPRRTG